MNLGVVCENEGLLTEAAKMYQRVVELQPQTSEVEGQSTELDPQILELQDRAMGNLMRLGLDQAPAPIQPPPIPAPKKLKL